MADPVRAVETLGGWRGTTVSLFAGALAALGQAPFDLWYFALAGITLALIRGGGSLTWRAAGARGFSIGFGYALVGLNWIVEPFLVNVALHGWMAPFGMLAMATGMGLFWGSGFAIGHLVSGRRPGLLTVSLALSWCLAELGRTYLFTGMPWAHLAYIWLETPVYRMASFGGPHLLMAATVIAGALLAESIRQQNITSALVAGVVVISGWTVPVILAGYQPSTATGAARIIRIVQPNARQDLKWHPDWREVFFDRLLEFTAARGTPDFVVWPEVAVTFPLDSPGDAFQRISDAAGERPVILGGQRMGQGDVYNSLIVLDETGVPQALYDKHHLVPFGEYFPGGALARWLGLSGLAQQAELGFSAGDGPALLETGTGLTFLPMICYEAIFPHELRQIRPARPDFLLHLTNDAWFGEFSGPYQHLAQVRARAIEFGLPVVRVANTGISGVIDRDGKVTGRINLGLSGFRDVPLPVAGPETFYWRYGDNPALILLFAALAGLGIAGWRKSH